MPGEEDSRAPRRDRGYDRRAPGSRQEERVEPVESNPAPVVRAQGVVKRYGAKVAARRARRRHRPRHHRAARPERRREDDVHLARCSASAGATPASSTVLGHDPADAGIEVRERIGYAPEHHNLPPDVHAARSRPPPRRAPRDPATPSAIQRANDALWQVGLGEERFRPVGTMSTGQRQRVKLAVGDRPRPRRSSCSTSRPTGSTRSSATTCSR